MPLLVVDVVLVALISQFKLHVVVDVLKFISLYRYRKVIFFKFTLLFASAG